MCLDLPALRWLRRLVHLTLLCLLCAPGLGHAAYPDKALKLVVPFPAGGPTDAMARLLAQKLSERIGQPVVIENRGGAGGAIAAEAAAGAPPDGYTLFFGTTGTIAINPSLYRKLRYDPVRDFVPVSLMASTANILVVNPALPANSVAELIALAKAKPGQLNYGSAGNGSSNHLSGALFESMAGIDMVHVPYKGSAAALVDLIGGRLQLMFDTVSSQVENVKAGKLRALGVTSAQRAAVLPQVPAIAEAGLPGFEVTIWFGVLAPSATPRDIVTRLSSEIQAVVSSPDMQKQLQTMGADPQASSPEAFAALIRSDTAKWARAVKSSGAQLD